MEYHRGRLIDHVHLRVADLEANKRFYKAVLAALGRQDAVTEGAGYFAAYVLDPDGNNIEAVHHGPARTSAEPVRMRSGRLKAWRAGHEPDAGPDHLQAERSR